MIRIAARFLLLLMAAFLAHTASAHSNKYIHAKEIQSALGFDDKSVYEWLCFISSDMIDKHQPFYNQLKEHYPGFSCSHRCLFHWNYNGKPWTPDIEHRVDAYTRLVYGSKDYKNHIQQMRESFLEVLRQEQKRRNGLVNSRTEELFGFASGGKQASYANFFAAMAYDLHLLGDYMTDNKNLKGLVELNTLIGGIISSINRLDAKEGKSLVKALNAELKTDKNDQEKADALMAVIQEHLPRFIRNAQGGYLYRHIKNQGIKFREEYFTPRANKP